MPSETTIDIDHNVQLRRLGAIALLMMPLCYVCMFVVFGVLLTMPQTDVLTDKIAYLVANQGIISIGYISGYLIFGSLLLVAVQALHNSLAEGPSHLLNCASAFGFIWVVLMMSSGMIALVGMNTMATLHARASEHAETLFLVYTTITNALGGGIELVGGLWVLLLSISGLQHHRLSKGLGLLGIVVGLFGVLTLFQGIPEFKDAFGLSQIVWLVWTGIVLLRKKTSLNGEAVLSS
jgi:hypothetical protein